MTGRAARAGAATGVLALLLAATTTQGLAQERNHTLECTQDPAAVAYAFDEDGDGSYGVKVLGVASRCAVGLTSDSRFTSYDDPELSPDGATLAVSTEQGHIGRAGIAVEDLADDRTDFRRITFPPQAHGSATFDVEPAWSPDGRRLLFTRADVTEEGELSTVLYTVPATGGEEVAVPGTENAVSGDWDPTGQWIVFTHLGEQADEVTVQRLDGSDRRVVAEGADPAWSPDGESVAYVTVTRPDPDRDRAADDTAVAVTRLDGSGTRTLDDGQRDPAYVSSPSWLPDGQSLVYSRSGYDPAGDLLAGELWAVDLHGFRAGRLLTGTSDLVAPAVRGPRPPEVIAGAASTYVPVTPQRVLDTRTLGGNDGGAIDHQEVITLPLRGVRTSQGPVPDDATAVVLNVTALNPVRSTDIRVYPSGTPVPDASNLNLSHGQTVANLVTVRLGEDGAVSIRNSFSSVHAIVDLAGWYVPGRDAAGFAPVDPGRILDTREGHGAGRGAVGPRQTVDLQVTGDLQTVDGRTLQVPATATAVVLNVTGTGPTAATDVRLYPTPSDGRVPVVSNLNLKRGQTAANLVIVSVGEGGRVRLRNESGAVHLIADLAGYYAPGAPHAFVPVDPTRMLDSRAGNGTSALPLRSDDTMTVQLAGRRGVPAAAVAAVVNLTATSVTEPTDLRLFPATAGSGVPTVSNLNLRARETRANLAVVRLGDQGLVRVLTARGSAQVIGDLAGYFLPPAR